MQHKMHFSTAAPFAGALCTWLIVAASGVSAQSLTRGSETDDEWRFSLTPYAFLPASTEGTSVIAGTSVDLDLDLSDTLDWLNFAFSGRSEIWKGDWGIIADIYYVDLEIDGRADLPGPRDSTAKVDVDITQKWAALMLSRRLAKGNYGPKNRRFAWDGAVGVRWNSIEQKVSGDVDLSSGSEFQDSLGGTETWWEPAVHLRAVYEVADKWDVSGRIELGGFGVNDDDLQYTVALGADWHGWDNTSLKFGYVFYGIDYSTTRSDGKFAYDIDQHGPFVGLTFRF